jgi:hypothetical protein
MHNFYAKLNIPSKERLFNYNLLNPEIDNSNLFNMYRPNDILSTEAIEFFKEHNLTAQFVLNFITPLSKCPGTESTRVLHTDNRTVNGIRRPIVCGINFEIASPTDTTWTWYNMDAVDRKYVEHTDCSDFEREIRMRAEVFTECGVPDGAIPIEKLNYTDEMYLVRTDIPHMVTYNSYDKPRRAISIRFEETWKTWEECWKVFEPIMEKDNT